MRKKQRKVSVVLSLLVLFNVLLWGGNVQAAIPKTKGQLVVDKAMEFIGIKYTWGGATPAQGFDCSGLTMYVYSFFGVSLPHNAAEQFNYGTAVSISDLKQGDLVFFKGYTNSSTNPGHVGIYVGNGEFIQAPSSGDVVKISPLASRSDYVGARRIINPDPIGGYSGCYSYTVTPIMNSPSDSATKIGSYYAGESYNIIGESGNWWQTQHGWIKKMSYIPVSSIPIMSSPSYNSTKIGTYYQNESFTFISEEGDWWQTQLGWIHVMHLTSFTPMNIMSGPSDTSTQLGTYWAGEKFVVISETNDWWQTQHGYIKKIKYTPSYSVPIMDSPNTNANRIGTYYSGETFTVIGDSGDWWQTIHGYIKKSDVPGLRF